MTSSKHPDHSLWAARLSRRDLLKSTAITGAALWLAPALAACGSEATSDSVPSAAAGPKKGGALTVGIVGGSSSDTLDPHKVITSADTCFCYQLYDQLVGYTPDYVLENRLAEEVSGNTDATIWTIRLKPELTWHDGKPVSADDVVYSFQRITDPNDPLPGAAGLPGLTPDNVVKVDERTVELRLGTPVSIIPENLVFCHTAIVPVGFDPEKPVGCGPFKLDTFNPGEQATFLPFDGFWGDGPSVDSVKVIEFADETARVNAFISDAVDAMMQLPQAQVPVVDASPGHKVLEAKTGQFVPFVMNCLAKPFDDVGVRQAMRLIIDRPQMIQQSLSGYGWLGNDMNAVFDPGYPKDLPQREQDLEQAKSLLKSAGRSDLSIELVTSDALGPSAVTAAQVFAEQAKGAGVSVKVRKLDASMFYGDDYLSWPFTQDFWYTRGYLAQASSASLPGAVYNATHFDQVNPQWLAIVQEAYKTVDEAKRNELVSEALTIEYDEGAWGLWGFINGLDAYNEKLGGVRADVRTPMAGFRFVDWYFK